jgi:GNAT superfamily N-acetyltransferase
MPLTIKPVHTDFDMDAFIKLPWKIYRKDPYWVPPIIEDVKAKLDPNLNPYWKSRERQCWLAFDDDQPAGRICAIAPLHSPNDLDVKIGEFGFFECKNDPEIAALLLQTAENWLKNQGCRLIRGPMNPSINEEPGFLIEGFNYRPVLMAGHNPPYYPDLITKLGYQKYNDLVARLYTLNRRHSFSKEFPPRLARIAKIVAKRPDVRIRRINLKNWTGDIRLACQLYNASLAPLPDFTPIAEEEFLLMAESFRQIIDPRMALIAEIQGKPAGFAFAFPDVNQALQKANGKLDIIGTLRLMIEMQRLKRVSFKILMILPEYQGRGIEALLIFEVAKAIWKKRFQEVDMSLAGDENIKSNHFQSVLGFKTYLRYRIFENKLEE